LEVDLLLGAWADKHVAGLSAADLRVYEALLNQETLDLYNIVTGATEPPEPLRSGGVLQSIRAFVSANPLGKADLRVRPRPDVT
jgi:succinate dehydrogenase flavin-adding protein (antitoxin of CptAB toxin-antitoxin module)